MRDHLALTLVLNPGCWCWPRLARSSGGGKSPLDPGGRDRASASLATEMKPREPEAWAPETDSPPPPPSPSHYLCTRAAAAELASSTKISDNFFSCLHKCWTQAQNSTAMLLSPVPWKTLREDRRLRMDFHSPWGRTCLAPFVPSCLHLQPGLQGGLAAECTPATTQFSMPVQTLESVCQKTKIH